MSYLQEAGDQKKYAKEAENLGFKLQRSSGKHEIWKHESGAQVPAPKSGSDRRGFLNFRRDLKRALTNKGALPTKPDKVKPEGLPTKVDKVIKTTRLSSAQRRQSNKNTRSGTPSSFSDFMNRLKPKPATLKQRMSQGYSNTLKSLPLSVKREMGDDIIRRMRYKPGQRYGISGIGLADEYIPEGRSKEQQYKGAYETLQQKYNKEYQDLKDVKPYKPTQGIKVKTAQGETLKRGNTYLSQIVPTSKNNQIPFKYTTIGIDTTNREEGLKKKVKTMERLGILHGGTRAKDLQ